MSAPRDASSRFLWPPTIYGGAALLALAASRHAPAPFVPAPLAVAAFWLGIAILAIGGAIALAAEIGFLVAGTATLPISPTTAIVETGIYRWTRNPMYLGMTLALIGLALALDQAWFALATPPAVLAVTKLAIEKEEAYLTRKFGETYLAYKRRVRRWI
ncbi:MAG: isoprenylcysteine carboxylmethyltransferase family protein [Methylobacteriaceae bacterium]|nr:isoprenylcysteine carboxylmethyltransferase family protein [Methylobacteriaceae bacterium]